MFMTSIPYDDGWSIYCDGEQMETLILLDGFLGADLPAGEHEIRMVYTSPGVRVGLVCTIVGIMLFAVLVIIERKKDNEQTDNI